MRRTKGFTLIELMVVVSIIALLAMMLVPALQRAVGMANKAACAGNLNSVYKGITLYAANNEQQYPMLPGSGWDTVLDGKNYLPLNATGSPLPPYKADGSSDWTDARSVTAIMFMLVRDGQGVKLFTCQADNAVADPTPQTSVTANGTTSMMYNWDFSSGQDNTGTLGSKRNVSYSFQCPITRGTGTYDTGIVNPDPSLVIMADRTPVLKDGTSGAPGTTASFVGGKSTTTWAVTLTPDQIKPFNSQNHFDGELFNLLYAGGNVGSVKNPLSGMIISSDGKNDLIYTSGTEAGSSNADDGCSLGGPLNTNHKGKNDTYLWGGATSK